MTGPPGAPDGQSWGLILWKNQPRSEKRLDFSRAPTTADAICDRILSNAHRVKLAGPSRRKQESNLDE